MLKRIVAFKDIAQQNNLIKTVILNTQSMYVCWLRKKKIGLRILIWRPSLVFLPINCVLDYYHNISAECKCKWLSFYMNLFVYMYCLYLIIIKQNQHT